MNNLNPKQFDVIQDHPKVSPDLARLAHGYDCPACGAYADEPCKTRRSGAETFAHSARIDKAVKGYQRSHQ